MQAAETIGPVPPNRLASRLGAGLRSGLAQGDWLRPDRIQGYAIILGTISLVFLGWLIAFTHGAVAPDEQPLGSDFASFKAAGDLAAAGHAADAFSRIPHHAAEKAAVGAEVAAYFAFFYPPVYLLACLPLAFLPYLAALGVWLVATGAAAVAVLRHILPTRQAILPMLAFPAVLIELTHGQNAFLTAALLGGGVLLLERRPVLAGMLLGCLCYKPQLAILLPPVLLAGGHWRAIFGAVSTMIVLIAISVAAFGTESWTAFLAASPIARSAMEEGLVDFGKMQSSFAAVRIIGGGVGPAYLVQGVVSLLVLAVAVRIWRMSVSIELRGAVLAVGSTLVTPFVLDYDFMLLALALAWFVRDGLNHGFRPYEKTAAFALYMLPLLARPIAMIWSVPMSPAVVGLFFVLLARRASHKGTAEPVHPSLAWQPG